MTAGAAGARKASGDGGALLVVLVETGARFWASEGGGAESVQAAGVAALLAKVAVLINAHKLLHTRNRAAVIALHDDGLHPLMDPATADLDEGAAQALARAARALPRDISGGDTVAAPPLSAALSAALCLVLRETEASKDTGAPLTPRVLVLHGSADAPAQYVAVMNAIFSAQRLEVCIDACLLGERDSSFLQQAAHLTGGLYLRPPRPEALLQYLLAVFAADQHVRPQLTTLPPPAVDFRASCFCHKRPVDIAHVCSVCLSIFCELCDTCSTCGTALKAATALT